LEETWEYSTLIRVLVLSLLVTFFTLPIAALADRESGYYYPAPKKIENFKGRTRILPYANSTIRIEFANSIVVESLKKSFPPQFAIFAKGINAERMIIISNMKGQLDTIYRVRALLATMTAVARKSPVLRKVRLENVLTFLDLAKMLGFKKITISDGDKFSHQVFLK
jgi:hypothetical protein